MIFISPVNTITLDCSGNVLPNAILIANIDATKNNKLLVGTQEGELLIFEVVQNRNHASLWRRARGLGFISAITVGSLIKNTFESRPVICVANAEGIIHLFSIQSNISRDRVYGASGTGNDSKLQLCSSTNDDEHRSLIQVAFSQQLICNPKVLLIQDFNGNEKHLIIGYCNRIIRIFMSVIKEEYDGRLSGRFILKHFLNLNNEIHTLSSRRLSTQHYELIVSQPGGNLFLVNPTEEHTNALSTNIDYYGMTEWTEAIALDRFFDETVYVTICQNHVNIFSAQLNQVLRRIPLSTMTADLCSLGKGPTTKDNYNQLVTISSINGDTFIIDRHLNIICFRPPLPSTIGYSNVNNSIINMNFLDRIQASTSGFLGDNNTFCFVYVLTHHDKIIIVHSIEINHDRTTDLLKTLKTTTIGNYLKETDSVSDQLINILHPHG